MGQKTNSVGLRLGVNRSWESSFFVNKKELVFDLFMTNLNLRKYIESIFKSKQILVNKILIKKTQNNIFIYSELYIQKFPKNLKIIIDNLKNNMEKRFGNEVHFCFNFLYDPIKENKNDLKKQLEIIFEVENNKIEEYTPDKVLFSVNLKKNFSLFTQAISTTRISSYFIAQYVANEIEMQQAYNIVLRNALTISHKLMNLQGVKISCSGRLNGVQMAKTDYVKNGVIPLNTLNAKIDFSKINAYTIYGVIGIKVWLCYN